MPTLTRKGNLTVLEDYDVAADAQKRISLRNAKTKFFHVTALSDGCFFLEPRVLAPTQAISARSLKMLGKSAAKLKKGLASAPIDLAAFPGRTKKSFVKPHPEDQKRGAYQRIKLSALPSAKKPPERER